MMGFLRPAQLGQASLDSQGAEAQKTEMPIDYFTPLTSMWVNHLPRLPSFTAPDGDGKFILFFCYI